MMILFFAYNFFFGSIWWFLSGVPCFSPLIFRFWIPKFRRKKKDVLICVFLLYIYRGGPISDPVQLKPLALHHIKILVEHNKQEFRFVPTFAVRETDVSRHQGGPIEGPPENPRTSQHYHIEGINYVKGNGSIVFSVFGEITIGKIAKKTFFKYFHTYIT